MADKANNVRETRIEQSLAWCGGVVGDAFEHLQAFLPDVTWAEVVAQALIMNEAADDTPAEVIAEPTSTVRPGCGTASGYQWHRRHFEPTCQPCRTAVTAQQRARKARKQAEAGNVPPRGYAQRAADQFYAQLTTGA